jgi:hypothetical protein
MLHPNDQSIGAYLLEDKQGNNLLGSHLSGQSLWDYIKDANNCFTLLTGARLDISDVDAQAQKGIYLHLYLHQLILQRTAWKKPQAHKEPYTYRMLANCSQLLKDMPGDPAVSVAYAIWDWLRLGVFTGLSLSEYAQSKLSKGQCFQTIPTTNVETRVWGGNPLAVIRSDFQFFTRRVTGFPTWTVHVPFQYDKGAENFSVRKFSTMTDSILDPVDVAISLLHCANIL